MKLRIPEKLVVVVASIASLSGCSSAPNTVADYNCLLRRGADGGGSLIVLRDGGPVPDRSICRAPACNGTSDAGGESVYVASNGDEAPNCTV